MGEHTAISLEALETYLKWCAEQKLQTMARVGKGEFIPITYRAQPSLEGFLAWSINQKLAKQDVK